MQPGLELPPPAVGGLGELAVQFQVDLSRGQPRRQRGRPHLIGHRIRIVDLLHREPGFPISADNLTVGGPGTGRVDAAITAAAAVTVTVTVTVEVTVTVTVEVIVAV